MRSRCRPETLLTYDPEMTSTSAGDSPAPREEQSGTESAVPSLTARILAFAAIVIAGICGGLIGYAFTDLQCEGDCTTANGLSAIIGAAFAAGGVAIVAVLAMRAMGEWQTIRTSGESESTDGSADGA